MPQGLSVRAPVDPRPALSRSRSHTDPTSRNLVGGQLVPPAGGPQQRPPHLRSHSSALVGPAESKVRPGQTLPPEKSSRLHIPGRGNIRPVEGESSGKRHPLRHGHSHSDTHGHQRSGSKHRRGGHDRDEMSHLVAGLVQERRQHLARMPTSSDWQGKVNDLVRISSGPYRSAGPVSDGTIPPGYDLRRALGNELRPATNIKPRTEVEKFLEKAEKREAQMRQAVNQEKVERLQDELDNARQELQDRLNDIGRTNGEMTRRLEYTFYNLLEKLSGFVSIINSFKSLTQQSSQLVHNFEDEVHRLDSDIKRRIGNFQKGLDQRELRVKDLEDRANKAGVRAMNLGVRLENASSAVANWEKREQAAKKKMWRIWGALWWFTVVVLATILVILIWREWSFQGDPVAAGLRVPRGGNRNRSLILNDDNLEKIEVPDDVRMVLKGIQERRTTRPMTSMPLKVEAAQNNSDRLRMLDEL